MVGGQLDIMYIYGHFLWNIEYIHDEEEKLFKVNCVLTVSDADCP